MSATVLASTPAAVREGGLRAYRITSIDMLRGLVIVIMALDHVRDFFMVGAQQDPMSDPNVTGGLFFTRWITHFCAPVFVLLAGTSAGLMVARKSPTELAKFLLTRGMWLVFIEWFVISNFLSFAPEGIQQFGGGTFVLLQVIWAIGVSMMVLAGCQFLGRRVCLALGAAILLGHNLLDYVWPDQGDFGADVPLWVSLHTIIQKPLGPFFAVFAYPLLPWIGVMLFGFGISALFERSAAERTAGLIRWGLTFTTAFILLRAVDIYGDPNHWESQARGASATLMDFLNTTKYPPSLSFLLMTLGPAALICAFADRWRGFLKDALVMLGRVPFAFYVPHFLLIHALSVLFGTWQMGLPASDFFTLPFFYPAGYGLPLWGVYAVWLLVVALLYPFCRWVAAVKARSGAWWLSYV